MAIVKNINTTGAKSNSTLSGNIALDHGQGEFVSYQTSEDGYKYEAYKIDAQGIHYYNELGVEITRIAPDGTYYYDENGSLLTKIAPDGTHYYDANGHLLTKISVNGFDYYDANGVTRINIGASSAGMIRIEMFDADGTPRTWVGQSPADGDQLLAVSVFGENVETNLNPNNRGGGNDEEDNRSRGEINDGEL